MQGRVLDSGHPCICPTYRDIAQSGVSITRAYTPNPVCSPARASMMTGLLPHSHGMLQVTQWVAEDVARLRDVKHWTEAMVEAGYQTGYFGKWHVEHTESPEKHGWQTVVRPLLTVGRDNLIHAKEIGGENGYSPSLFYGITATPIEERHAGLCVDAALGFISEQEDSEKPWCAMISVIEPHVPFLCGKKAFEKYDAEQIPVADSNTGNCPGLYRKAAMAFTSLTQREKQEAAACYYGIITEVDSQLARVMDFLRNVGQLESTLVVLVSDHGELLGSHGLYYKNIGAYEEVFSIPMVFAGPWGFTLWISRCESGTPGFRGNFNRTLWSRWFFDE
jgi:choline-sulfatase